MFSKCRSRSRSDDRARAYRSIPKQDKAASRPLPVPRAISRDTKELYLTNRLAGTISVIDFATRIVEQTWVVGGSPDVVQVSPDGSQLWVSNRYGTTIDVVATSDGRVIKRIEVGPDPHGLAYFPQPGRLSLGHNGVYR